MNKISLKWSSWNLIWELSNHDLTHYCTIPTPKQHFKSQQLAHSLKQGRKSLLWQVVTAVNLLVTESVSKSSLSCPLLHSARCLSALCLIVAWRSFGNFSLSTWGSFSPVASSLWSLAGAGAAWCRCWTSGVPTSATRTAPVASCCCRRVSGKLWRLRPSCVMPSFPFLFLLYFHCLSPSPRSF